MRNINALQTSLERLGACDEAVKWCRGKNLTTAWRECERVPKDY
jgi:hypothetical protein